MKLVYKRSSAATALAMPEEIYVSEPEHQEPAPAGALHRVFPPGQTAAGDAEGEPYIPQRGAYGSYGMRVRGGMPRSVAGRVLLASGAFSVLAGVALTAAGIRSFLLHDGRFLITDSSAITIQGNEHISRAEVLSVFGADLDRNIFKVPLGERRADLERLPWVSHATLMRLLPNHLRIQLTERTPVAFTRQGTQIGLVDDEGVLLDMPPESAGDPHYSFPVLTGLAPNDTPEIRATRMEVYRRFMADLSRAGAKATQTLSEVDVTNPEDVKALITTGDADILVHFGDENFLLRYQAFERHLPEWRTQYPKLASADMRYERQVVLEMQPGNNAPLAADAAISGTSGSAAGEARKLALREAAEVDARRAAAQAASRRVPAKSTAANQRVFAKLAAAHRAAQSKGRAAGH